MRSRSRPSRRRSPAPIRSPPRSPSTSSRPTRAWDAREGDRDSLVPASVAPSDSDGRRRLAPAPDHGDAGGHPPDHAYRRDESTLRYRLTDGANEWQQARTHTSGRSSSPQAIRREPVVGIGDSVRSADAAPVTRAVADLVRRARRPHRRRARGGEQRGRGPDRGAHPRAVGRARGDRRARARHRAARRRPGRAQLRQRTDRQGRRQRHPARGVERTAPRTDRFRAAGGRRRRRRTATAAVPDCKPAPWRGQRLGLLPPSWGFPTAPRPPRRRSSGRARASRRATSCEIRQRVNGVLEFPKPLALRLEQGETVVYFAVGADGRLSEGPRVLKSSGFAEFDSAAIQAVRRAAPFPAMPFSVPMRMAVTFDNPVIR